MKFRIKADVNNLPKRCFNIECVTDEAELYDIGVISSIDGTPESAFYESASFKYNVENGHYHIPSDASEFIDNVKRTIAETVSDLRGDIAQEAQYAINNSRKKLIEVIIEEIRFHPAIFYLRVRTQDRYSTQAFIDKWINDCTTPKELIYKVRSYKNQIIHDHNLSGSSVSSIIDYANSICSQDEGYQDFFTKVAPLLIDMKSEIDATRYECLKAMNSDKQTNTKEIGHE